MTRLLIVKAAIAALVFSILAAMAAEGKLKTVEELSAEMKQHGCRHQFFNEEDQDQCTLLITCALEVVSRDKDLRKWFFVADLRDSEVSKHRNELTASFVNNLAARSLLFYYKITEFD